MPAGFLPVRPPALAKDFHRKGGSFFFRHVIEPYVVYRRLAGINNYDRIIRFDYIDAIADTNEIEFGIANRFFTRRSTENVTDEAVEVSRRENRPLLSSQPYEALTITLFRWSTDAERTPVIAALKAPPPPPAAPAGAAAGGR